MRLVAFIAIISSTAFGQTRAPAGVSPSTSFSALRFIASAGTGQAFGMTQGTTFCLDGTTCSKTFTSNGTTLTLNGLGISANSYGVNNTGVNKGMDESGSALRFNVGNGNSMIFQDSSGNNFFTATAQTISVNTLKVPVVHGSGTANQAIESGTGAMTAGSLAVTFGTAFGAAPICVCSHIAAVPLACGPTAAASTTAVTFAVATGGSTSVNWYCIGQR